GRRQGVNFRSAARPKGKSAREPCIVRQRDPRPERKRDTKTIFGAQVLARCARFLGPERWRIGLGAIGAYTSDHSRQSRRFICDEPMESRAVRRIGKA